uniref:Uncharacterized protein n=1 Tax=Anopheles maculatus TaxID=74869 RepID=A0A182SH15_9DIPT
MKIANSSTPGTSGASRINQTHSTSSTSSTLDASYGVDSLQETGHTSSPTDPLSIPSSNGASNTLRYLRKQNLTTTIPTTMANGPTIDLVAPSGSSSHGHHHGHHANQHGQQYQNHQGSSNGAATALDGTGQLNLDSLFGNISIDNYEFDDNATIQSFSLIEEKFKTSFDQIQEKLDAELPFDEEQIKWQNNIMTNDSSNEIGDKLLTETNVRSPLKQIF